MTEEELAQSVFKAKPKLKDTIDGYGANTYAAYLKEKCPRANQDIRDHFLDEIFFRAFNKIVERFFGPRFRAEAKEELTKTFFASTAEHGGILCHPFFSDSFLSRALHTKTCNDELVLTLACSGISLDNSSYARGLVFHDNELNEVRLHIKSLKEQHSSVYVCQPYTKEDILRVYSEIENSKLSPSQKKVLTSLVHNVFDREDQYSLTTYDEQTIRPNWLLPKHIRGFEHLEHLFLSQELLVSELLQQHLHNNTFLTSLLLDPQTQKEYLEHFEGKTGAHNNTKGTFLFWGVSEKNVRIPLHYSADGWYTKEGNLFLKRDAETILEALQQKRIFPCMALTFITLSFVHQITCSGGFSQINYLGELKDGHAKLSPSTVTDSIATDIFTADIVLNTLEKDTIRVPATLLDIILYQDDTTYARFIEATEQVTLKDAIWAMMPEYYKIITGESVDQTHFPLPPATLHVKRDTYI